MLHRLLLVSCLLQLTYASQPKGRTTGGVRNTGYFFNRNVPYSVKTDQHGRRAQTAVEWAPVRMEVRYTGIGALTAEKSWWLRLSSQVYLAMEDFERLGEAVLELAAAKDEGEE